MLMVEQIIGNAEKSGPAHARRIRGYVRMLEREGFVVTRVSG
jgi:hypothetical protein